MSEPTHVIGFEHLEDVLEHPHWATEPLGALLDKWAGVVQRGTVRRFKRGPGGWIDTTASRRSVTSERDQGTFPKWARVGSNLDTFRWGELGTGLLSEDPKSKRQRHWPPVKAVTPWAKKRKLNPYLVARAIGLRGGLEPRRYLRTARDEAEPKIPGWLNQMARAIERAAEAEGAKGLR